MNNHILHKINDEGVIRSLRQTVPGIDEGLWRQLPGLAPGQAIVSAALIGLASLLAQIILRLLREWRVEMMLFAHNPRA